MTDQGSQVTSAPRSAPDFLHELFWGQIDALLGENLERYQPKMGTVSGIVGSSLLVLPDGSATPRRMPHVAGRRFNVGDRVIFGPVKGQPVVIGGVLTATGAAEAVVANEQILAGAIGTAQLANGAVTAVKLGSDINFTPPDGSITTAKLADQAVTSAKLAGDAVTSAKLAADAVTQNKIAAQAVTPGKLDRSYASDAHNHSGVYQPAGSYAPSPHAHDNYDKRIDVVCKILCNSANCQNPTFNNKCTSGVGED